MEFYKSRVKPNLGFRVLAGNCLAMAQGITGAPVMHESATAAAGATRYRHYDRNIPNAVCVLWFDHYGSYGLPGREIWKNWGHVIIFVPGLGYASSSPVAGETSAPYFYSSISDVERAFNCTFRFWSEDINGTRVCELEDIVTPQDKKDIAEMTAKLILDTKVTRHPVADKLGTTTLRTLIAKSETLMKRNISRFDQFIALWKKQK